MGFLLHGNVVVPAARLQRSRPGLQQWRPLGDGHEMNRALLGVDLRTSAVVWVWVGLDPSGEGVLRQQ